MKIVKDVKIIVLKERINTADSINYENGTLNALGVDIKISDIIGEKIVNPWMATLSEEDMELIFDTIEKEVFSHNYDDSKYFITNVTITDTWGNSSKTDTPLWSYAKRLYQEKFNEKLKQK